MSKMPSTYNLIEEAWIPCRALDGSNVLQSLRTVLEKAHVLEEILDPSPLITGSIYRLLLALLHRSLEGPRGIEEWKGLWNKCQFNAVISSKIIPYFKKWHDRFYLLHDRYPFYQVHDLEPGSATTIAKLAPHLASGNNPTLFDHTFDKIPPRVSFARATRWLLMHQNFALGGLLSPYKSERMKMTEKSAKAAPLAKAALVIVQGNNLFETLLLNLEQYDLQSNKSYGSGGKDMPAWEREDPTIPNERIPAGLVDWLTWQSRSVRLFSEDNETIAKAINMNGYALPKKIHRKNYERMVAFKKSKFKSGDPFPAVGFSEKRTIWRDSNALFQTVEGNIYPKIFDWIELIYEELGMDILPVKLYGAGSDQASYHLLRQERFPFHPSILKNEKMRDELNELLDYAEKGGKALWSAIRVLIIDLVPDLRQKKQNRGKFEKKDTDRIRTSINATNLEGEFWSHLEIPFKREFQLILTGTDQKADQKPWKDRVYLLGLKVLNNFLQNSNFNGRFLRAMSHAQAIYSWRFTNA